jgi:hypothetical protein
MAEHAGADDPARARPVQVDRLLPGDRGDGVARLQHGGRVGVEIEVPLLGAGVAPRDHEHLLALLHEPLDQAAPGRKIEHVVLVDRRRDEQQRHLAHLGGLRGVLDQLEHVRPQHDRARRQRQVLADRELRRVDRRGKAREVAHEAPRPAREVEPALVDALLDHARVRPREVARRERVEHVAGGEARLALVPPVELGVGDQAVDGVGDREVRLDHAPEQPARLPRRVGEAPVALAGPDVRAPARDAGQLRPQAADAPRGAVRTTREAGRDTDGRARSDEPRAPAFDRRVGQHDVERGLRRIGCAARAAAS